MDSGWAVVLGAVIALAGSSLIPWLRDSIAESRQAAGAAKAKLHDAVVAFIRANGKLGFANGFQDQRVVDAYAERSEAVAALLLQAPNSGRAELAILLEKSVPVETKTSNTSQLPRVRMYAIQATLADWAAGAISVDDVAAEYERHVAEAATRLRG